MNPIGGVGVFTLPPPPTAFSEFSPSVELTVLRILDFTQVVSCGRYRPSFRFATMPSRSLSEASLNRSDRHARYVIGIEYRRSDRHHRPENSLTLPFSHTMSNAMNCCGDRRRSSE